MTRISIVTPSYNQRQFIGEALESVRVQGRAGVEHLVLDGASTDGTVELLRSLGDDTGWSHVSWQSAPDGGQSEALNRGFRMSTGEIVGWLNSDDRYRPGCFDLVLQAFHENPEVDVFYGDYTWINREGEVTQIRREIEFNRFILLYHRVLYIPTPSTFFRRRIFDDGNWLRNDLHFAMDYEFIMRLAVLGYRIRRIPQVIADFRMHPQSKSCSNIRIQLAEKKRAMQCFSPISRKVRSPLLRRLLYWALERVAGWRRWSEKLLRGHYFVQYRPSCLER